MKPMNTIDELEANARRSKLVSSAGFNADGIEVDGWAEAESAKFVFADGNTLTVPREVLRDPDFGLIDFKA